MPILDDRTNLFCQSLAHTDTRFFRSTAGQDCEAAVSVACPIDATRLNNAYLLDLRRSDDSVVVGLLSIIFAYLHEANVICLNDWR